MHNLSDTIHRLSALRDRIEGAGAPSAWDRLANLTGFGTNPGALRGRYYVPDALAPGAPLVVVLHGCTQDAGGYDRGSGWSQLADELGFALLYPEQSRANNANLCFNWFNAEDTRRGAGEPESIRQMIVAMCTAHALDPARVYVTGLSAGGAMTSVMLATYPELFAGGAIIAGLPYGTARSVPEAFDRMRAHGGPDAAGLGALVSGASDHAGPWPSISVWHGDGDRTVSPANAALIVEQWRGVHGVASAPSKVEKVDGHSRSVWCDGAGRAVIEEYRIAGLGHGTPLRTAGDQACGTAGPHMLEAGISSTRRLAGFWGLGESGAPRAVRAAAAPTPPVASPKPAASTPQDGVAGIIEGALRAAGLMR